MRVDIQRHGYANGHQLLATSISLDKRDQDTINRLSDVSGPIGPGEDFQPYLTGYPLPSGRFVLARTWPDKEARRAGCVRTLSLVLDGEAWSQMRCPASLLNLLTSIPSARTTAVEAVSFEPHSKHLPPVSGPVTTALVEALFLEQRKPVVCFQTEDSEVAALRLVEALWPAMRRPFAFCTYALQARTIDSRSFDLLFAPKAARSRYSDWPGRKLELGGSGQSTARHAWSLDLADAIFRRPEPDLKLADSLGVLSAGREGDATALRFAMLWRELADRTEADPSAALGMLDILSAAQLPSSQKIRVATDLYAQIAGQLRNAKEPAAALTQLRLLLSKLPARARQPALAEQTASVTGALVARDPQSASVLFDVISASEWNGLGLLEGVSNGLAASPKSSETIDTLAHADPEILLAILGENRGLLPLAMSEQAVRANLLPLLRSALAVGQPSERDSLCDDLVPLIRVPAHAQIVPALLGSLDSSTSLSTISALLGSPGAVLPEIQHAVADALLPSQAPLLRTALQEIAREDARFDYLREVSFAADGSDLAWIAAIMSSEPGRALDLLHRYLAQLGDDAVGRFAQRNAEATKSLVRLLARADSGYMNDAARILTIAPEAVIGLESDLVGLLKKLPARQAQDVIAAVLAPMVRGTDQWQVLRDALAMKAGDAAASSMKSSALIGALVPSPSEAVSSARQSFALQVAANLPKDHALPEKLVRHISSLAERLSAKATKDLGEGAIAAWSDFLSRATVKRVSEAPNAAIISLGYAMRWPHKPTAPLARIAFPIVLWAADQPRSPLDQWGRWMGYDIDNAREIREGIVAAYLTSEWPSGDLLWGAWYVDEASKVAKILKRTSRGLDALATARKQIKRVPDAPTRLLAIVEGGLPKRK